MHEFHNYLEPLSLWLQYHPQWALFFTFIISFAESLAIIGAIIPGSVTMTAIGILAGSGIMRIDLTFLAAILGAIAGDSVSYAIGRYFSEGLTTIWPFKRYPEWLRYGKAYFMQHGGKSVLIGRFVGPLRSIIPVVAGMMYMNQWRFIIANIISAIGWSVLYIMPGIFIGAATNAMPAEAARRLLLLVLAMLIILWLFMVLVKWLISQTNRALHASINHLWARSQRHPWLAGFLKFFTPNNEMNHSQTVALLFITLILALSSITLVIMVKLRFGITQLNTPIYYIMYSIRMNLWDPVAILFKQFLATPTVLSLYGLTILWFLYQRRSRPIIFSLALLAVTSICVLFLQYLVPGIHPAGIYKSLPGPSCPDVNLMQAAALFAFLGNYLYQTSPTQISYITRIILALALALGALASLYLGDYWLSDILIALFAGLFLGFSFWLFYRKNMQHQTPPLPAGLIFLTLILAAGLSMVINKGIDLANHRPYPLANLLVTDKAWWHQQHPLLPLYRQNRFGRKIALLNVHYAGELPALIQELTTTGWTEQSDSILNLVIQRLDRTQPTGHLPIIPPLFENKRPALIMTRTIKNHAYIMHMWPSTYHLQTKNQPLWIGSIELLPGQKKSLLNPTQTIDLNPTTFSRQTINLPVDTTKGLPVPTVPILLLIKDRK